MTKKFILSIRSTHFLALENVFRSFNFSHHVWSSFVDLACWRSFVKLATWNWWDVKVILRELLRARRISRMIPLSAPNFFRNVDVHGRMLLMFSNVKAIEIVIICKTFFIQIFDIPDPNFKLNKVIIRREWLISGNLLKGRLALVD